MSFTQLLAVLLLVSALGSVSSYGKVHQRARVKEVNFDIKLDPNAISYGRLLSNLGFVGDTKSTKNIDVRAFNTEYAPNSVIFDATLIDNSFYLNEAKQAILLENMDLLPKLNVRRQQLLSYLGRQPKYTIFVTEQTTAEFIRRFLVAFSLDWFPLRFTVITKESQFTLKASLTGGDANLDEYIDLDLQASELADSFMNDEMDESVHTQLTDLSKKLNAVVDLIIADTKSFCLKMLSTALCSKFVPADKGEHFCTIISNAKRANYKVDYSEYLGEPLLK